MCAGSSRAAFCNRTAAIRVRGCDIIEGLNDSPLNETMQQSTSEKIILLAGSWVKDLYIPVNSQLRLRFVAHKVSLFCQQLILLLLQVPRYPKEGEYIYITYLVCAMIMAV